MWLLISAVPPSGVRPPSGRWKMNCMAAAESVTPAPAPSTAQPGGKGLP
ncbi:Uncharacterised protein [Bordetella pertussis]|nr:Uncharacterised protein [Bordetella pertussis]CFW47626.1 Uncharacterised protein [Bordetella pertussis]